MNGAELAGGVWTALALYTGAGALVWVLLAASGFQGLAATLVPLRVRALLLPGTLALWPLLLMRRAGVRAPEDRP